MGPRDKKWAHYQSEMDRNLRGVADAALDLAKPMPGERVLDIGCGSGETTLLLGEALGSECCFSFVAAKQSKSKLQSRLHEARWHCANNLAERGIVDVAIDRVCAEKLSVIKSVEGLKTKFESFGFGESCIF